MITHLINSQTEKNKQRLDEYRKKMELWVIAYGKTHRAVDLYFTAWIPTERRVEDLKRLIK